MSYSRPSLMTFQEKALVGAFSVITNLRMDLFEALMLTANILIYSTLHSLLPGHLLTSTTLPLSSCLATGLQA